jgi:glutamate-1-semialdehyde 2,1-aminomutase
MGSLCGLYFPHKLETVVKSPNQMYQLTDLEKVDQEFRLRMMNRGVFVMHGGGAVSFAHTDEDMARVIKAAEEVAYEMKKAVS